ncbi:MmcQ/YjbR family DNA-binding protein [Fulvivirga lutea]|uniref:MmcQ/YjbR family DNA-binding protein n=1 Tax=Fulvivirga lutea TaxID=2810512 RepID=A0A975A130_9BACT|nr:MmcQ/YjbR family DNA-binding protein [Fulvivirga lutea]QSE97092.1 MmcQ/YjbR family DNA-binding protein [Fulvivirga lutea]
MNIEFYREYCIKKPGVTESFPFDNNTLVFKVMNKMFALCDVDLFTGVNLKCDPERAIQLREQYDAIIPGYHMNKTHWNTVQMDETVPDKLFLELIDHSYELIVESLPKKAREELAELS